ncbi:MAG: class I SAM-dependent methyltransferase [Bacteroidota bacterium]|nr:class I SAM-dependent methyltransferase [Bacteroidota bacterium]MDP4224998.1 class I SAM-dependent methyltransferase [Bacteroidota bacterium]
MEKETNQRVCPVENAGMLEHPLRRLFQNPSKILKPYIKPGMNILEFGCGPGFFTLDIAKMLGESGKVIAADLQEGMLEIVRKKIQNTALKDRIELFKCPQDKIGITEQVDLFLAFYVVHEVPDQHRLFTEIKSILKPGGKLLIVEPGFHVKKKEFDAMTGNLIDAGFIVESRPKVCFSRAIILKNK